MESVVNIGAPEVGVGGAVFGVPTWIVAKFNNGMYSDAFGKGCTFPTGANNINVNKGTIEFWAKLNYIPSEVSSHYLFDFRHGANTGGITLFFNKNIADFNLYVYAGGVLRVNINTTGVTWNSGDLVHFALTWDREGNDIGGGKTVSLKINDVEEVSSVATWAAEATVNANIYVGTDRGQAANSLAVIDQFKAYDTCKTDFSDRNTEHCNGNNPPTAPTSLEVDGQSTPTGANCVTTTPQFTAIFNDPDGGDQSNAINIQVGSASGLSDMWDSGWLVDATIDGNRCNAKNYAGVALSAGTSYWWRCRFRDDDDAEGVWSAWQEFYVCAAEPEEEAGLLECAPGGPLPKRCPFRCAVALPRRVPVWLY